VLGIIGGSGLYDLPGLIGIRREKVRTPFGDPSDEIVVGRLGEEEVAFVARHGAGHRLTPSEVPYRANLHALKQLGATRVVSVSAVGSMKEAIAPADAIHRPDGGAAEHVLRRGNRRARRVRRSGMPPAP
jgi:5'-methylthioadenosine phosphorylase